MNKIKKHFENGAYAIIERQFVWNAKTEFECVKPTLSYLCVPDKHQCKGLGTQCIRQILEWMKEEGIEYLAFDNYAKEFWKKLAKRMPQNVQLAKQYRNRLGILRINPIIPCEQIFPKYEV